MSESFPNQESSTTDTWVNERNEGGLIIGTSKQGTEWILDPETKKHTQGPFEKIENREGILIGKGRAGESLLDSTTGKSLAGPFAMDSLKAIGDKYVVANGKNGGKFFLFDRATGKEVGDGHFTSIEVADGQIIGKRIAKKDGRETIEVLGDV